jgi:hypothetical protein
MQAPDAAPQGPRASRPPFARIRSAVKTAAPVTAAAAVLVAALASLVLDTGPGPSVDAAGTCPPDEELARLNPEIDGSVASQKRRTAVPARAGLPLYRRPALAGATVARAPSGADDRLVVMVGAKLGASGPALVLRVHDNVCGWMDVGGLAGSSPFPQPGR